MNDMSQTDKMLSRREGAVGYLIFNNPERHNAVSLDMWAAATRILEEFRDDDAVRVADDIIRELWGSVFATVHDGSGDQGKAGAPTGATTSH